MRSFVFLCIAALLLSGCKTTQVGEATSSGGATAAPVTEIISPSAKALITPEVIKQCADEMVEKIPTVKFLGPFFVGAQRFGNLFAKGEEVLIAVPTSTVGAFNGTYHQYLACAYDFHDNQLEFTKKIFSFKRLARRMG
ncbi:MULTISPECIES: hypothetical protein [Bradyrhizobium]|jgi:hypothetical protein|uniref:hypothetical protein n=1 Tax=Bradyrhizobium TaxID=374 RepID=UPI00293F1C8A|nr:hypothetical protein [Bradyrhizobium sp. NDS-1]WOH74594.1 hypothetical protein RX330_05595 [Bradyrhizobium sp. NDS-1]